MNSSMNIGENIGERALGIGAHVLQPLLVAFFASALLIGIFLGGLLNASNAFAQAQTGNIATGETVEVRGILRKIGLRMTLRNDQGRLLATLSDPDRLTVGFRSGDRVLVEVTQLDSDRKIFAIREIRELEEEESVKSEVSVLEEIGAPLFDDMTGEEWFARYVRFLSGDNVIEGYGDGTFRPYRMLNEAELLKVVVLAAEPERYDELFRNDIKEDPFFPWFFYVIRFANERGLLPGGAHPFNEATRAEVVVAVLRAYGIEPDSSLANLPYSDIAAFHPFAGYISRGTELGLISGYPDGTFKADWPVNRAELAKIVAEGMNRLEEAASEE